MQQGPEYTITFNQDGELQSSIESATGIETKWFATTEDFAANKSLSPVAVFIDATMSVAESESGQLIPRLKDCWPQSPIFLVAAGGGTIELSEGIALGADDYVTRPIVHEGLRDRLSVRRAALARRASRETITFGEITIDTLQRSVVSARGQRYLSPTEVRLLAELAKARGQVVPREQLKLRCWPQESVSDNALNRKLYEIRRRIKPLTDGLNIRTIYGVGFIMEEK